MSEDVMSVFNEIYEKQIVPLIIPVEKSRIQFLRRMFTSELFLILTTLLATAGCCKTTEYFGVAFLMLCLAMITFSFAVVLPFSYMREFSQKVMKNMKTVAFFRVQRYMTYLKRADQTFYIQDHYRH